MNRLGYDDKNYGPLTFGSWHKSFSIRLSSGADEDPENNLLITGFGRAVRLKLPGILKPFGERWNQFPREYGFALTDMDNGYDFIQIFFGPQTHDSTTTRSWSRHLPWKQWNHVRCSIYAPDGKHFATEGKGKWHDFYEVREKCPASYFGFEDYDGEMIVATCVIEEREWHRGTGKFKWLRHFYPVKIHRSLDLKFSAEVGPGKGSWKGGTVGHGIDMLPGESPQQAFERYCSNGYDRKGRNTPLRFIGPCRKPDPKPQTAVA